MIDSSDTTPTDVAFVYALSDSLTPTHFRYIGISKQPQRRLNTHLRLARRAKVPTHKERWICALLTEHREVCLCVLEEVPIGEIYQAEQRWIRSALEQGHDLTNATDGGQGWINITTEARQKLSDALKGKPKTQEHIRNAAAARRGWHPSQKQRQQIARSLTGRTQSKETIEKRVAKLRGRKKPLEAVVRGAQKIRGIPLSAEHKQKLSVAHIETPERLQKLLARVQQQIADLERQS